MKRIKHVAIYVFCISVLINCTSDVDLKNVDTQMDIAMNMAVPMGDMTFYINDFIGRNRFSRIVPDEFGIYHFKDSFLVEREFHDVIKMNKWKFVAPCDTVQMESSNVEVIAPFHGTIKYGDTITNPITLMVNFYCDLDSLHIKDSSKIPWNDDGVRIDKIIMRNVTISLPHVAFSDSFYPPVGQDKGIDYRDISIKPISNNFIEFGDVGWFKQKAGLSGQAKNIFDNPIELSKCTLTLAEGNKLNTKFPFTFEITINPTHVKDSIVVGWGAKMVVVVKLDFADADNDVIWGYVKPSDKVTKINGGYKMEGEFLKFADLTQMNVTLKNPTINCELTHYIAGPFSLHINHIKAMDSIGATIGQATWKGDTSHTEVLTGEISVDAPLNTPSVSHIILSNENGNINQLFHYNNGAIPDSLSYSVSIKSDTTAQYRLTKNMNISTKFSIDIPFTFQDTANIEYNSLSKEAQINKFSIDSLQENDFIDTIQKSDVQLFITMTNTLPFALAGRIHFLNKNGDSITMQIIKDSTLNYFTCDAPEMDDKGDGSGYIVPQKPSEKVFVVNLSDAAFRKLAEVQSFRVIVNVCEPKNNKGQNITNMDYFGLDTSSNFKIRLGIATGVRAIVNFNKKEEDNR